MAHAVLIIDDESSLARNVSVYLQRHGYETRIAESAEQGLLDYPEFRPDLVLLDHNLPGMNGLQALQHLKAMDPECRVVLMTGFGSVDLAVSALKQGAEDYLTKPLALGELKLLLERLLSQDRLQKTVHYYAQRQAASSGLDKILGQSAAMVALRLRIERLLESESRLDDNDAPAVLIQGETGVGKELVARALHFDGPRRDQPFVELNCGALPSHLIEAELFGHERGAFTGAHQRKVGLVETAEGGTLFLDEIAEADPATQVKLLKLLEDKRFRRLGGLRDQQVNVRIVSATHRPLDRMVEAGLFRADLYFRLRIIELQVPPLRERDADMLDLARHFLDFHARRYRRGALRLSPDAEQRLLSHRWPGNVRELRNAMEQAALLASGNLITSLELGFLSTAVGRDPPAGAAASLPERPDPAGRPAGSHRGASPEVDDLNLERHERRLIDQALRQAGDNVTQAARLLGISRDTLRYRLERLGLRAGVTVGQREAEG